MLIADTIFLTGPDEPLGHEILELRRKKDELLDMLWIVDSSATVKKLLPEACDESEHQLTYGSSQKKRNIAIGLSF